MVLELGERLRYFKMGKRSAVGKEVYLMTEFPEEGRGPPTGITA